MTIKKANKIHRMIATVLVPLALTGYGAVVYVSPDGKTAEGGGEGTLTSPYDLVTGVAAAGADGEVRLLMSESHYLLTEPISPNHRTLIGWNGETDSPAGREGRDKVVIDGGGTSACIKSTNLQGCWKIADLTLVNGCPTEEGSLLYSQNALGHSMVTNCVFRDSSCTSGARSICVNVYEESDLKFIDCDFRELEAQDWFGFIYIHEGVGSLTLSRCRFFNNVNTGPRGSYGSIGYGNADFTDCVISNNTGTGLGGFSMGRSSWTRCLFSNNRNSNCGTCLFNRGTMVVNDCFFTNNVCTSPTGNGGGCIASGFISGNDTGGNLFVSNSVFIGNSSHSRGAVASFRNATSIGKASTISFANCHFVTNISGECKTGTYSIGGSVIECNNIPDFFVENCHFIDNVTTGCYSSIKITGVTNSYIRNSLFLRNRSFGSNGGGSDGTVTIAGTSYVQNCTFVGNSTDRNLYGALAAGGHYETGPEKLVSNCIFYDNSRYHGVKNAFESACNSKTGDVRYWNCFSQYGFLPEGKGNIGGTSSDPVDPLFVSVETDDYRLKKKSPCVNAGLNADWMVGVKDLQGLRRPSRIEGGTVDIGCYEYLAASGLVLLVK